MLPIFFFSGDSHTKELLVLLHSGLEGVTEIYTDPKGRFVSFKVISSNTRVLCIYAASGLSTRQQLARGRRITNLYGKNVILMKAKLNLEILLVLWMKWTGMVEIKHKSFIDVAQILPRENLS